MDHTRIDIPIQSPVASLNWRGDVLIDWAGGNRVIGLNGEDSGSKFITSFGFDAAVQSPSGRYSVLYERLGTKAVVFERANHVREFNRSYYFANSYEYPIALFTHPDGRDLIAHCPDEYNRIEIEELATGKRLTGNVERKPDDFFHSRLAVSPDQRRLLSTGWIWHPLNSAALWSIDSALVDPRTLDVSKAPDGGAGVEINDATFVDSDRVLLSSNLGAEDFAYDRVSPFRTGHVGIFDLRRDAFELVTGLSERVGSMLWLGDGMFVGFYETPRVFDLATGKVTFRWPDIATPRQDSSIILHYESLPPLALDPVRRRFAVAANDRITVIQFR